MAQCSNGSDPSDRDYRAITAQGPHPSAHGRGPAPGAPCRASAGGSSESSRGPELGRAVDKPPLEDPACPPNCDLVQDVEVGANEGDGGLLS